MYEALEAFGAYPQLLPDTYGSPYAADKQGSAYVFLISSLGHDVGRRVEDPQVGMICSQSAG